MVRPSTTEGSRTSATQGDVRMNNWQLIKEFYEMFNPHIMAEKSNEWGIDPYAWDTGLITMTPIERCLWYDIRLANIIMYPQYPVAGFFLDFANPKAKVGIECDGYQFHLDKAKDRVRDQKLNNLGWKIYRISGADCIKEYDEERKQLSPGDLLMRKIMDNHKVSRSQG